GCRPVEGQRDARLVGSDERVDHAIDVTARQVVSFELVLVDVLYACLVGLDEGQDDAVWRDAPEAHRHQAGEADLHAGRYRRDPQADRDEREQEDEEENDRASQDDQWYVHQVSSRPVSAAACGEVPASVAPAPSSVGATKSVA